MCRQDASSDIVLRVMQMWEIRMGGYETPCDTLVVFTLLLDVVWV